MLASGRALLRDPTVTVFLSLYLLLLAFFIVLNSIADNEATRARAAMGSLSRTFAVDQPVPVERMSESTSTGDFQANAIFRSTVQRLFEETLPVARFAPVQPGDLMQVDLPLAALFRERRATVRGRARPLLAGIADSLNIEAPGQRFEVELLFARAPGGAPGTDPSADPTIRRAGTVARELRRMGAPAASIAIGVFAGAGETARLIFRARARPDS